jgi:glycosyltransferase involved in cell wall biosynthesis
MSGTGRVGYVVKRYPRYSETFIVNEILAHEAAGLEIEIFSLRPPIDTHFQDRISEVQAPVHYLPSRDVRASDFWCEVQRAQETFPRLAATLEVARGEEALDVHQSLLLALEARFRGIHHLHAHFASAAATVARLAARLADLSYSFTAHAKDIFHEDVDAPSLTCKLRDAAAVATVSDYNEEYLRERYGPSAACVRRIYNGLDLERFPYFEPRERPPRILAVGRLVEKKGFADLVDACRILAERGCDFGCEIVGAGPLESELRARIDRLELSERVELTGPRPQNRVKEHLCAAAVFAAPCVVGSDGNRDGLPTVLLEAMALGTPCISTDVTGIPEVLRDGKTGRLVPQHDPEALAAALERMLADPVERVGLARRARALIESEFDVRRNAARLREMFAKTASSPARTARSAA